MQTWWIAGLLWLAPLWAMAQASTAADTLSLVPWPSSLQRGEGRFELSPSTRLQAGDADARVNAELLNAWLQQTQGWQLRWLAQDADATGGNVIRFESTAVAADPESYALDIASGRIRVAGSPVGQFYAVQTLLQLLPAQATAGAIALLALRIDDTPRFAYRGMHLDVGRHLYPVDFIKKLLDRVAHYKLNRFHWHLTEDQGWRIEIKRYPRLTEVGGQRRQTDGDGRPYGGYYTQAQVREIVAYAGERHIMVIPEIEMPGHSLAALAAYPQLACTPGPFEVATTGGVFDDIYCPGEDTFVFLQNVLDEVIPLFPAPYVHIGGDEAPKRRWQQSPLAQAIIAREGLKDEHELQSWFVRRIERFLHSRGKRLIGWDEILEGGLAPDATVMSWRGEAGGIAAAREGHDVIMTPTRCCYFDYGQGPREGELWQKGGELPIDRVYAYDPMPAELAPAQRHHVLGVQANLWTERMPDSAIVEYMAFPRLLALAEIAWTPQPLRAFDDFERRLSGQYPHLAQAGIAYRIPPPLGLRDQVLVARGDTLLALAAAVPGSRIHYSLDGSEPTPSSPRYQAPLALSVPAGGELSVRTLTVTADGRHSGVHRARLRRLEYRQAQAIPAGTQAGASYRLYDGLLENFAQMQAAAVVGEGTATAFDWRGHDRNEAFGLRFEGWLQVGEDGLYRFLAQGDDATALYLDGEAVVHNETYDQPVQGVVPLRRGWHRLRLDFYQRHGDIGLKVEWARDGMPLQPLPADQLRH